MAALTEKRERLEDALLLALFNNSTVAAAATAVGISERSAYRWLADEAFAARWQEMKRQRLRAAMGGLESAAGEAVETLRRNLTCGVPSVEVRAATAILDLGLRAAELLELETRIEELERLAEVRGVRGK